MIRAVVCGESPRTAKLRASSVVGVLLCLGGTWSVVAGQAPRDTAVSMRDRGERLRHEQRLPEALDVYQALVVRDPTNFEDRFWLGKLESWTGRLTAADSMFTQLLEERPADYDSQVALADVRMWRGQYPAALSILQALNRIHPNDPEVLCRLGRLSEARGNQREARDLFAQALAADPGNADAKQGLSRLAGVARWQTGVEYYGEQTSNAPATNGTTASVEALPGDRLRWRLAATVQDKFDRTETRFGGELAHALFARTRLEWSAYIAPGAEIMPRQTYGVRVAQKAGARLVLYADYTFLDFSDAQVHQLGPHVEVYAGRHWLVTGRYSYSSTRFAGTPDAVGNHSGALSLGYLYGRGDRLQVFVAAGAESFAQPSHDLIGGFQAHTLAVAWRQSLLPRLGLALLYAHQDRSDGNTQDSYSLGLVQRW
jgi:YaiO family outer membrane protein